MLDALSLGPPKTSIPIAMSTTKADYITMWQAWHGIIPIMWLLQEMREQDFNVLCTEPYVYCKVFEHNSGALELARLTKLFPRSKLINVCYHHFCKHVQKGLIKIFPIDTTDQVADALTKPLAQKYFNIIVASCAASDLNKLPKWGSVTLLVLWYLFYRYLRVPPGTTWKSTAPKCNILLSIKIHICRDPMGIVKYGHVSWEDFWR